MGEDTAMLRCSAVECARQEVHHRSPKAVPAFKWNSADPDMPLSSPQEAAPVL